MALRCSRISDMGPDTVRRSALLVAACCGMGTAALADLSPVTPSGLPPQIIPSAPEVGLTILQMPGTGNQMGSGGTGTGAGGGDGGGSTYSGSGTAYDQLMAQSYGAAAAAGAQQAGINVNTLADIALVESNFRNIPTASGSTPATGVWQTLPSTFNYYNAKYGLGFSPPDVNNPADQAVVASYTNPLRD